MKITVNGLPIAYTDDGDGHPLLFIHGFPLNRQMWAPQVGELAKVARVIAPDLRGHGESPRLPGPYEMDLLASDMAAFLDALAIKKRIVICGLSMGGYVAFAFYRKYPERLRAMILTATRAAADTTDGKANRDAMADRVSTMGIMPVVDAMAPKLLSPISLKEKPDLAKKVSDIMQTTSAEGMIGALMGMKLRPDTSGMLKEIQVPTLVVHGADDQIVPLQEARQMADKIPGAQFEMIPLAGHLPNLEQPELFNKLLMEFILRLPSS